MTKLNAKIPEGPLEEKWKNYRSAINQLSDNEKNKLEVIVVGTGLSGASAAATLAEQGYRIKCFCLHDSPRRAHSIAAQGGINAAKNYKNDGDTIFRLFNDTIKSGDYRAREANVYRLAEISNQIIDLCVAQGVPFTRDYNGKLDNISFGGSSVARTFYARGQTGQQLLLAAYGDLSRQINEGNVTLFTRTEMLDLVVIDGKAKGIITRNMITGEIGRHAAHAVILATGGYGNSFFLSTNAMGSNGSALWQAYKRGAFFANPSFVQIHPTCIPIQGDYQSKLTLMSEGLRNVGRIWVPMKKEIAESIRQGELEPNDVPEQERDYYLERKYPAYGNLVPRDIASRAAKERCDKGYGVGSGLAVYLDFKKAIEEEGRETIWEKYSNLFRMYEKITNENPLKTPMKIYPAVHYTMGGLWVDYELMTTIPGLFAVGECNFSDHGANRLGASALMQGLADGYFILPYTIQNYLQNEKETVISTEKEEFELAHTQVEKRIDSMIHIRGEKKVDEIYRKFGLMLWDFVGMVREKEKLKMAMNNFQQIKDEFRETIRIPEGKKTLNQELEKAGRVADFIEIGILMARDALYREESCGGHFRIEHHTKDGETKRDDKNYMHVSVWEYKGQDKDPVLHKEKLNFEQIKVELRDYR